MKTYKLDTVAINELATNLCLVLQELEMDDDVCIYFDNKRARSTRDGWVFEEDMHPRNYCAYAAKDNILTITSEGSLYMYYDYHCEMPKKVRRLLDSYGLYLECATSWCWSAYLAHDSSYYTIIDYDMAPTEPEVTYISLNNPACPSEIKNIMEYWYHLSEMEGDKGCCVLGAGFTFKYKEHNYEMAPCSPWQGEESWTPHVPFIKTMLEKAGAENVKWDCGIMD